MRKTGFKTIAVVGCLWAACVAYAAPPVPAPAVAGATAAAPAKQWETDAAVRQGMENIRQAMVARQPAIQKAELSEQDYQALAQVLEQNRAAMEKNHRLAEDANKAFHTIVLTDLTQGVQWMRTSPKVDMQRVGALGVLQVLRHYGEYFQHPGWQPVYADAAKKASN